MTPITGHAGVARRKEANTGLLYFPSNPTFSPTKVPFLRWGGKECDDGAFLQSPTAKASWLLLFLKSSDTSSRRFCIAKGYNLPSEEKQTHYQTWFFFGLLAVFYGINELNNAEAGSCGFEKVDRLYKSYIYVEAGC